MSVTVSQPTVLQLGPGAAGLTLSAARVRRGPVRAGMAIRTDPRSPCRESRSAAQTRPQSIIGKSGCGPISNLIRAVRIWMTRCPSMMSGWATIDGELTA